MAAIRSKKDFVSILADYSAQRKIYDASETLLKEGFGILLWNNNPDSAYNDYFRYNDADYQYVKKALEKVDTIMPLGTISQKTFKNRDRREEPSSDRYDAIEMFACEAKEGISREDIAALTKAFNRVNSAHDSLKRTQNRPVVVLIREKEKLTISTCQRSDRTPDQDGIGRVIILHNVDCAKPKLGHLQILEGMAKDLKGCSSFDDLYKKLLHSLDIDIVSDHFFDEYTKLFKKIVKEASDNKLIEREFVRFPDAGRALRNYVKKLLGRIVFIQFLQRKGWMGVPISDEGWTTGQPEFLQDLFEDSDKKDTFVDDVLLLLFNDLNTKRVGDLASDGLGKGIKIPYLNGGLFDRDEYDGVSFPLPADTMREILSFFRKYNFTIDENDQDTVEVGVDPEMLSRIFESLLEDNKATGAFYTPKEIVEYMCRESLITYLQSGVKDESKKSAYREFVMEHRVEVLSGDLDQVDEKLRNVKICDPAIGSGAFPMGMLKELFECRRSIRMHKNGECDLSEIKKDILQHSIYGVDIDKGAVDIARLRFWLALIIDEKTPHSLPNMDFKIMQGNSLLEQYEGVDLSRIGVFGKKRRKKDLPTLGLDEGDALTNIQFYIREYYKTDSHEEKEKIRDFINDNVRGYIRHLCTPEIRRKVNALPIPNDQFFLWHLYFKEVFDEGGFDIVIGNPPYIELQNLKGMSKVYARCGFSTYSPSADIYCLFTEQGFNLLKKGGTLCYIMMNKWMKAEYGQSLRRFLLDRKIHEIVDFGDVQFFKDATTYPCIVLLGNDKQVKSFKAARLRSRDLTTIPDLADEFLISDFSDDLWVVSSRKDQQLFRELDVKFRSLKDYLADFPAKYGIKTGLTDAFILTEEKRDSLVENSPSAKEVIVPFLTGKDIRPYEQPQASSYLILFRKGDTLKLMGRETATEQEAWDFLQSRYPSICARLKQYEEKGKNRSDKGDFWWELRACAYYGQFGMPKIMYQTFQVKPNFIYDTEGRFCNNSVWIIPTENKALLGLFNSKMGGWLISTYCTLIQSGHQLIWDYFSRIPIAMGPDGDEKIAGYVDRILAAKQADATADTSALEHEIDCRLYEIYGLTNGEVKVVDPLEQTFGADFEPYQRKPDYRMAPEAEIDRIYTELKERFDKIAWALGREEKEILGNYDVTSDAKPSKEELEDAFDKWNCAILTSFRGCDPKKMSKEDNLARNIRRNDELKAKMRGEGLLFQGVDGYYLEIAQNKTEKEKVNELSFFVTNTDVEGARIHDEEKKKAFFKRIYRLAEHYEQDSFLFTFPGANRVAFLVATNDACRANFRNDAKFAGPLYTDIEDLDAWTGCRNDGKVAFLLKGMVEKVVPDTKWKVWIGEGDIFDIEGYSPHRPDCLVIVHDGQHKEFGEMCDEHRNGEIPLSLTNIGDKDCSAEDVRAMVSMELESLPKTMKTVGFHCSTRVGGSYAAGAKAAFEAVLAWAETRQKTLSKIVVVDMFGDYWGLG